MTRFKKAGLLALALCAGTIVRGQGLDAGSAGAGGNAAPALVTAVLGQYTVVENQTLRVRITGIDPDGDPISFATNGPVPAGSSFSVRSMVSPSEGTAEFAWTPPSGSVGTHSVTLAVHDGLALTPVTFTVRVEDDDSACVVALDTPLGVGAGAPFTLEVRSGTAPGSPFFLVMALPLSPAVSIAGGGIYGHPLLGVDPATMIVLLDGFSVPGGWPLVTPFTLSGNLPPPVGVTLALQALIMDQGVLFLSPPINVTL